MLRQGYAFSFSGLKTAVLRAVRASDDLDRDRADLARDFQDAAIEVLVDKTARATEELGRQTAVVGGRRGLQPRARRGRCRRRLAVGARGSWWPSPRLNTDNAAMIAAAGAWRLGQGERAGMDLEPFDRGPLPGTPTG